MKKYKHKLTGNIAVETNSENNYKISEPRHFTIPKWVIENSSDWEEIVEKEYEINGRMFSTGMSLRGKQYQIISIKRLSDGEVFSIYDNVTMFDWNAKDCFIEEFIEHTNGKLGIVIKQQDTTSIYFNGLDSLQKVKRKLLFTTIDNVKIYEGDKYFSVCKKYWIVLEPENTSKINYETYHKNNYNFSTKEKAEEYILTNKPCLSINEILDSITAKNAFKHKWLYNCKESVSILKDVVKEKNV